MSHKTLATVTKSRAIYWNFILLFVVIISRGEARATSHVTKSNGTTQYGVQQGFASYYSNNLQGHRTVSGVPYDRYRLTAAHKTLPLNSKVEVTMLSTNKKVLVTINDRGPFSKHRVIDLSYQAAKELGLVRAGVAKVKLRVVLK